MTTTPTSRPIESHDIHSERLMEHAERQLAEGDRLQASEKAWGAVAHQLKVVADQRGWEYSKHQHVYGVVKRLAQELRDPDLMRDFIVADGLHKNFYVDLKPQDHLAIELERMRHLLDKLQSIATNQS